VVIKPDRSDKTEIKKNLFKNQRPPAEVGCAPSWSHPHTPSWWSLIKRLPFDFFEASPKSGS
jgi:hypothetical protein